MKKLKVILALLCAVLLCAACGKQPAEDPTGDATEPSGQTATEEMPTEEMLPGVEENDFEESDIMIPGEDEDATAPDGQGTSGNQSGSNNQGSSGNQGGSNNQGTSGNQGGSNNQGSSGNEGGSNNQGSSGNEGTSNNQGSSGNEGGSNNQGSSGNEGGSNNQGTSDNEGTSGNQGSSEKPTDPQTGEPQVTYEDYSAMSPDEQVEFFNQFASMEEFVQWYNDAKEAYDAEHGAIDIGGDGSIDLGDIINP